jgi:hypothetical protein
MKPITLMVEDDTVKALKEICAKNHLKLKSLAEELFKIFLENPKEWLKELKVERFGERRETDSTDSVLSLKEKKEPALRAEPPSPEKDYLRDQKR